MTKTEIKRRLKTLDKLEARWRKFGMKTELGPDSCELCIESVVGDDSDCDACTLVMATGGGCYSGNYATSDDDGPLELAITRKSIRPITDAIRKMRKWLKKQEGK